MAAIRARLHVARGDLSAAAAWAADRAVSADDDPDYLREYEHLTLVRLLLARHRDGSCGAGLRDGDRAAADPLAAADALLQRLHAAAGDAGREGSLLEIRLLQALLRHAAGDLPGARAVLVDALRRAPEPDAHVRLYLDEGAPMLRLLHDAERDARRSAPLGGAPAPPQQVRRLLQRATTPAPAQPLLHPLSPRELDVLRLLDSDLTGPQIAAEMYVTLNTLRTHTKRIFTKLDVRTRVAAVRRAHERGLL